MGFKAYEASSAQKRLYMINHLMGDSILYNETRVCLIKGRLEPGRLKHAARTLAGRHEILRTCFAAIAGEVLQKVYEDIEIHFQYTPVQIEPGDIEAIIDGFLRAYNLGKVPLWRIELVQLARNRQLLLLDFHHIIADGTSMDLILKELTALYRGEELPEPQLQYVDFTTWQNDLFREEEIRKQEAYWLKVFEGEIPVLDLPTDYPRSVDADIAGSSIEFEMGEALTSRVNQLASQHKTSLYVVILAAFNVLLLTYSNQEDIVVGTPISGRTQREFANLVGMFVNTLAMRNNPTPGKTFKEFLAEVSKNVFSAFENQEYQFEMLVEKVVPQRHLNRNPLFDVMLALQNYAKPIDLSGLANEPLELIPYSLKSRAAKFDLILQAFEIEDHILFKLEYRTALFRQDTVERMTGHLINIFREVTAHRDVKISEIPIISEAEREHLLYTLNGTFTDFPAHKTIHELFEEQVGKTPGKIAVIDGSSDPVILTYRQLDEKANQLAHWLRAKGVGVDTVVALLMGRSPEMVVAILGILKAGGAYLPIDSDYPEKRIITILEDNRVSYLLTRESDTRGISFTALPGIKVNPPVPLQPLVTAARQPIKDFDRLPLPDRTLVNYEKYHQHIGIAMARHTVSLQATRGCPYNCAYCHKIWPKKHVTRSAGNIFKEMRHLYDAGVTRFVFIDDIFNLDKKNSSQLLEMIVKKMPGVQLFFPNGLRGDILAKEFIDLMLAAGTMNIDLALESASPRIQKLIGKNLHLEKFDQNVRFITGKYPQLLLEMELMIGFPTETEEEALMTIDYLKSLQWVHFPNLNILKIYPNTDMCRLALENGTSMASIESSVNLAYHELPDTLPFSRGFTRLYQARFMNEYMLSKERLLCLLPHQVKTLDKTELIQKYDSYFPKDIRDFPDILALGGISQEELAEVELMQTGSMAAPGFVRHLRPSIPPEVQPGKENKDPLRILLLDLSQYFSRDKQGMLYDMVEEPLGLMYLLTYLNHTLGSRLQGKIAKSRIDFDSFDQLKALIDDFSPHVMGIRTLSYYKEFFHKSVALIRGWGVTVPIIAGGPYASSDYRQVLQDVHVDLAVLGEGELTLSHLVIEIMAHENQLPPESILQNIPGIAFIKEEDKEGLNQGGREVLFLDQSSRTLEQMPGENPEKINRSDDLLYLISTSGSTGKPKSVMLEHRNMVNLMHFQFTRTGIVFDKVLQFASIGFDISAQEIFSTLLSGGELYLINRELRHNIPALLAFIEQKDIHVLFLPPAFLKFVFEEEDYARQFPKGVRHIIAAGEQLIVTERFRRYLFEKGVYLHNHYGPAETHVVTVLTIAPPEGKPQRPSIGTPIANTRILILDENLHLKPLGVVGEIFITGANVGRGYYNREDLTVRRYMSNPFVKAEPMYRTGDLARWNINGQLEFLGRKDQQVKIRGFRIEPEEIEKHLAVVDFIKEAVVVDRTTASGDKYLIAYLVCESKEEELSELRKILSRDLPDYMIPSYFKKIEKIPLNPSGKVDRKALRAIDPGESPRICTKTRNSIEAGLVEIWGNVLKKEKKSIATNQSFFELGGHSLNGTILISKIHKQYHVWVPLAELFKNPTIQGLAQYIAKSSRDIYEDIRPVSKREYYPQSSAQKRLFFLDQLRNIGTSYNMPAIFKIGKAMKRKQVETAFRKLVVRHESLRTSFHIIAQQPVQEIHHQVELEIEYYDILEVEVKVEEERPPKENPKFQIPNPKQIPNKKETKGHHSSKNRSIPHSFVRPFDLSAAPLVRVGFIGLPAGESLLLFDMHHIITDGTSIELIIRDFLAFYAGNDLEPLRIQYKDFSQWQNSEAVTKLLKNQEGYWLKIFQDDIPGLRLPTDFPRPEIQGFAGSHIDFELAPGSIEKLQAMARQENATLYIVLLAIFNILLHKLSNQGDIVVGTPVAARRHADLEKIIGMFVNTLAMRNFPEASTSFKGFLKEVRDRTLTAFENQDYPFEDLVDRLSLRRDMSRNPLFDVMFALHNQYQPRLSFPGAAYFENLEPYEYETHIANFDLELHGNEMEGRVDFILVFSTKLFKRETAQRLVEYFKRMVEVVIDNPTSKIAALEFLRGPEKESFRKWYKGAVKPPVQQKTKTKNRRFNLETGPGINRSQPRDQWEDQVAQIWSEVLETGKEGIAVDANFFDMGGHSLKAAVLVSRIHKAFNIKIPMEELFKAPTVRGIARFIQKAEKEVFAPIAPAPHKKYYTLSSAQGRLYILQQMEVNSTVYNMPLGIPLEQKPGINKLEKIFKQLIHRHESLRTSFHMTDNGAVQEIHDEAEFEIENYDMQVTGAGDRCRWEDEGTRGLAPLPVEPVASTFKNFIRPFDLSRAPLLRLGLIHLGKNQHILMIDLHHIIADGISLQLLAREFTALYQGKTLSPAGIQYKDFAEWQKGEKQREKIKNQEAYWLNQFADEIPAVDLPLDYPRPAIRSFAGNRVTFELAVETTAALKSMAAREGATATLYMVLLGLFNILLSKLGNEEKIPVGTPVAGRGHAQLDQVMGMFVNTLVLCNYPGGEKTFSEFLIHLKTRTLRAFENQDYPFEDLVDKVMVSRDTSRNPLFDVMFVMQNIDSEPGQIQTYIESPDPVAKFDLTLTAVERSKDLFFEIEYCGKLFKKGTIERFIAYFKKIISTVVKEPKRKLAEIEIITAEEKHRLLIEFNDTETGYPVEKTLHELFAQQAGKTPDNIAIVGPQQVKYRTYRTYVTYISNRELNRKSHGLACLLREKGVEPDTIVGIMAGRSLEMVIGIMGILKAGGAYLPIDPGCPEERIHYILADSGVKFLLAAPETGVKVEERFIEIIDIANLIYSSTSAPTSNCQGSSAKLAYIIYTSGSTGKPKGVIITHQAIMNYTWWAAGNYVKQERVHFPLFTSICFDLTMTSIFTPLITGNTIVVYGDEETLLIFRRMFAEDSIGVVKLTPSHLKLLRYEDGPISTVHMKRFILGGEILERDLALDIYNKFKGNIEIYNEYGPTEATVGCMIYQFHPHKGHGDSVPIGKPIGNTHIYILDRYLKPVPMGVPGELCISGAGVARGYLNNPELTARKFLTVSSGYYRSHMSYMSYLYRTGDLARWRQDGNIEFLGRIDRQVKIRGFRIQLAEIENRLLNHDRIQGAVVMDRNHTNDDKYLCAYVVPKGVGGQIEGNDMETGSLKQYLSQSLPGYMIPSYFVILPCIPLTPNGKVDRKALPAPGNKVEENYAAPRNKIENKLGELWSQVLEVNTLIGIDDDFFELGGHSLKATRLTAKIHKEFHVEIPLVQLFKTPFIRGLARYIKDLRPGGYEIINPAEKKEYYPLSSAQRGVYAQHQKERGRTAYNMPQAIILDFNVHMERLEQALNQVIRRNESLRTSFEMIAAEPVQRVHGHVEFEIEYDAAGDSISTRERIKDFLRPFDLVKPPLLRVGLIEIQEKKYILMIDMHHMITDGVSGEIFKNEVISMYNGEEFPPLRIQYKDFIVWQSRFEIMEKRRKQGEFWLKQFEREIPVLDMPYDYERPARRSFEGGIVQFVIDEELGGKLKEMSRKTGATLYMILLAAYYILLSKYTRQEDIVVGSPVTGRNHADLEYIIGMFVNMMAVRNRPGGNKIFKHFLMEVKEKVLDAVENQDYHFEELVVELGLQGDVGRNPLFDVVFSMAVNDSETPAKDRPGDYNQLKVIPYELEYNIIPFDLIMAAGESHGKIEMSLAYSTVLYKRSTVEKMARRYTDILNQVTDNDDIRLRDISISHHLITADTRIAGEDLEDFEW